MKLSIILPAKNEAQSLNHILPELTSLYPDAEIIVVNDGSTDDTQKVCESHGVRTITHPYCKGNGAAIKTGANAATGDTLVFMDADGQHRPQDIANLLEYYKQGFHMVIGSRKFKSQASIARGLANKIYNSLASWVVEQNVMDLTSGFRIANAKKFREFLYLLPNGFSYPTTITMSFFRAGYSVGYKTIDLNVRSSASKSHINLSRDGVRFLLIIFKIGTLYSPLKIFFPLSLAHFALGLGLYVYTYLQFSRFTNMSALLFTTAVLVFLIGLISEQITSLIYRPHK